MSSHPGLHWLRPGSALLFAALASAGAALLPWPSSWPMPTRGWLGPTVHVLAGAWGGPWAALGLALGQVAVASRDGQLMRWETLALCAAAASRALLAWSLLAPGRADPRLLTPKDWRRWALVVTPAASLIGATVAHAPQLAQRPLDLTAWLVAWLKDAGTAAAGLWVIGTLLLRWLSPLWRRDARHARPRAVDLASLLASERLPASGKRR